MSRTTVDIDTAALNVAKGALGTEGLSATVNAALREVARQSALAHFDVQRDLDGTPAEVETGREDRNSDHQG